MSSSSAKRSAERLHGRTDSPRKRRRPATSCEACRTRKVRCDQGLPCGPCKRSRSKVDCVYRSEENNGSLNARSAVSLESDTEFHPNQARVSTSVLTDDGADNLAARIDRLERLLDRRETGHQYVPKEPSPVRPRLLLRNTPDKTRLFGPGHWMYIAQALVRLRDLFTSQAARMLTASFTEQPTEGMFDGNGADFELRGNGAAVPDIMKLFLRLRTMRKAVKARSAQNEPSGAGDLRSDFLKSLPPWTGCEKLLNRYWDFFDPLYRIVQGQESIWAEAKNLHIRLHETHSATSAAKDLPDSFLMKLGLMLALGGALSPNICDELHMEEASQYWIRLAQSWLTGQREKETMSLEGLRVFCLLLLAKQTTRHAAGLTWISAGSLVSAAMSMGLHRDPVKLQGITPSEGEARKRLWAATLELTVQAHLDTATPILVSTEDFDAPAPRPPGEAGEDLQSRLFESLPLRLRVARLVNGIKGPSYDEAILLANELRAEARDVVAFTQGLSKPRSNRRESFHSCYVDMVFHRYILMLLQPWMVKSRVDSRYYLARKMCTESALVIASYATEHGSIELQLLAEKGRGSFRGPISLPVVLVLCLETFLVLEEEGPTGRGVGGLDELLAASRARVASVLGNIMELTRGHIRDGSVSLKSFNFMASFLAQFRAIEEGRDPKRAVFNALSESLQECARLVQEAHPWLAGMDENGHAEENRQEEAAPSAVDSISLVSLIHLRDSPGASCG